MKKLISSITAFAVILAESRHTNEDGSWDTYWAKKNCRAELKTLKAEYRKSKTEIKTKWRTNK